MFPDKIDCTADRIITDIFFPILRFNNNLHCLSENCFQFTQSHHFRRCFLQILILQQLIGFRIYFMTDMFQKCQHFFIGFSDIPWTAFHLFRIVDKKVCFFSQMLYGCLTQGCLHLIFQMYRILKIFFCNRFCFFFCDNRTIAKANSVQIALSQFFNNILYFLRLI